jgi:hypothetical protein
MWIETLIDAAIFREWIVNVGRRDSITRISHLLCELALRLEAAGLARDFRYEMPMTQEQLADCTGLTPVHVNRVLKELGRLGLIDRDKRSVAIVDWDRLQHIGDFNTRYLHMEVGGPTNLSSAACPQSSRRKPGPRGEQARRHFLDEPGCAGVTVIAVFPPFLPTDGKSAIKRRPLI